MRLIHESVRLLSENVFQLWGFDWDFFDCRRQLKFKTFNQKNKFKYPTILNSVRQVTVIITRQKSKEMELTRITLCFNFLIIIDPVLAKYYNAKNYWVQFFAENRVFEIWQTFLTSAKDRQGRTTPQMNLIGKFVSHVIDQMDLL